MIDLLALDIAGTTVDEGGAVYRALTDAVIAAGGSPTAADVERWMGAGKREAITALLNGGGAVPSDDVVDVAYADFRRRLDAAYAAEPPRPFPGVRDALAKLRADGVRVALTTGFDREVTDAVVTAAGLGPDLVDTVVCIDDVPAGRPAPYLIFRAMERTAVGDVAGVLVAGDTPRDMQAGRNAGAGFVVGVRTGGLADEALRAAGATHLLDSIADLPTLVRR